MGQGPIKIVMIEDDLAEINRYWEYVETVDDLELVAASEGATQGLAAVMANRPDVILLDLELKEGNGIQLLPKLKELDWNPFVMVITWTTDPVTINAVRAKGSGYVQSKCMEGYAENGPKMVADFLREMRPFLGSGSAARAEAVAVLMDPEKQKDRQIGEALGRIGVTAGSLSHAYLRRAILIAIKNPYGIVELENEIYPILVKEFHVTRASIEICMRRSIDNVWKTTDVETLEREYTQYVNPEKGKPELKEFIGYYADKFR